MRRGERQLQSALYNNVDAFERNNADDLPMSQTVLQPGMANPDYDAEFDINIITKYFTVSAGAYTLRTAAYILANAAVLATTAALAFFLFGQTDFWGGYKKIKSQFALAVWTYNNPFIYGPGSYPATAFGVLDATALAQLQLGDIVLPFSSVQGGVNYTAIVILRCTNVAHGTLLAAISSDTFIVNRIRYIQNDTSAAGLSQYGNAIYWFRQSLFGRFDQDSITPNSQKPPYQYQNGIIDVGLTKTITKEIAFGCALNYDAVDLQWSVFVKQVNKLPAAL
jgi:hypothetical protein